MLNAEPNRRERILDFVRHLPRHFSPCEHAGSARQRGCIVQRDDAAIGRRTEERQLQPDLATIDLELTLGNHVAIRSDEFGDGLPQGCPRGGRCLG